MYSPAPAPPPATSCLHHIPVIFSSSENSSGIKMSADSPMFTAWERKREEGEGRRDVKSNTASFTDKFSVYAMTSD